MSEEDDWREGSVTPLFEKERKEGEEEEEEEDGGMKEEEWGGREGKGREGSANLS